MEKDLEFPVFSHFPGQVTLEVLDGALDDAKLIDDEVRQVVVVALDVEVRHRVLSGSRRRMLEIEMYCASQ